MLCSASVNALQIMFSNSSYESTAKWKTCQIFKEATLVGISRAAVSKVMMAYTNHRETSSAKRNSGQKPKLSERDCCTLKRTV